MMLDSLIFLCGGGIMMLLVYLFRADRCRLSRRGLMAFCAASAALHVLLYIPYALLFGATLVSISWFELFVWGLFAIPAFWLYPGHGWKTLFLWLASGSVIAVCVGAGNLSETLVAVDSPIPPRLAHVLVTVAVSIPVMAGVLAAQRRFTGLYGAGGAGNDDTWRQMAVIAGILFLMVCIAGNVFGLANTTPLRFLLARLVAVCVMLAVLSIAGLAQRQAVEASEAAARAEAAGEAVRQKEEAYARIVDSAAETARLRHDLRQMFAAMQGMNEAGKELELEAYCREVLAQLQTESEGGPGMGLLNTLFGWTGYEPLGFFLSGMNVLLNAVFMLVMQYYPLRRFLRVRLRTLLLIYAGFFSLFAVFYLSFPALLANTGAGQITGMILGLLVLTPVPFLLLRDCTLQNVFATAYALCFSLFVMGIGNFIEFRFGAALLPGVHSIAAFAARLVLIPVFLPLGIHSLQKLFSAWRGQASAAFWKVVWVIPLALFALSMLSGNVVTLTNENSLAFLLSRILSAAALLACAGLMSGIMRREQEVAAARVRKQMLDTAGKAFDESAAETLAALQETDKARRDAGGVVEQVMAFAHAGGQEETAALLQRHMAGLVVDGAARLCENEAVNALAGYYSAVAQREGIEVSCKLDIPRQAGQVQNVDLSRIVGNMLENAIEACCRMEYGTKSIRLQSKVVGDMLALGLTNSFDGNCEKTADGRYLSQKRESGIATGLASIQSIAGKYGGTAKFEAEGRVFKSSVRLDMGGVDN